MSTRNSAVVHPQAAGFAEPGVFKKHHVLDHLRHYLPTQTPLRDFIHHNSLHAFQDHKFYDALFKAGKIFGYQVTLQLQEYRAMYENGRIRDSILERVIVDRKGIEKLGVWKQHLLLKEYDATVMPRIGVLRSHWKKHYRIDLDNLVQPLLFRIIGSYLDQGIAQWKFPLAEGGFLASLIELEANSFSGFFRSKRVRELFLSGKYEMTDLLWKLVGDEAHFEQYLFDQQFSHRGWSGMVATVESAPHTLLDGRPISLHDFIVFELLLEIDALDYALGKDWEPVCNYVKSKPADLFADVQHHEIHDVLMIWQDAFEWSYYDEVLKGIQQSRPKQEVPATHVSFQAMFCIDERECSLRRHIERTDPLCETLGTPGFFGVEFYFQAEHALFYDKLCPAPVTPKYLVKEKEVKGKRKHELLYSGHTHRFFTGTLSTLSLGFFSAFRLVQNIFRPRMSPAISNAFAHMGDSGNLVIEHDETAGFENGLQVGFTVTEMAARVEGLLRGIGLVKDFAPLVYAIAHGSSSANNPHHGAHDCGACSGRPGSVNARVFAHMANHTAVRNVLRAKGINIPESTQFVGGLHDTAADQVQFYDVHILNEKNRVLHGRNIGSFENALDLNARERSRRFASINTKAGIKKIRKAILDRSVSMFEPRPELGHGTNTLCIIGRREITKNLFLDRRAFLNSYDHRQDPEGNLLTGLMRPIGPVCGGINLEYYFSRVDNYKLGAGTKLPHNVMGLIGVANSSDGDLRPGLPLQMIEVHDPVRLMVLVEHYPEVVLKTIRSAPEMYEWYLNEWVHIISIHPGTGEFYYFRNGAFHLYEPLKESVPAVNDLNKLFENSREMRTNDIMDATKENLPVYSI